MAEHLGITCDTDTVGCIAGALAEAYYGSTGFDNEKLLRKYLVKKDSQGREDMFLLNWSLME